ncbi:MAG: TSUP family transporter [Firmicutes bacterium]|nr:TSUP family transporter [Bacillota bacterium]
MELTLQHFIIVCPLVFAAGFVDAIAGGGGLISLPAYILTGMPVHNAIATNKLSACMGTTISASHYIRKGYVPWKVAAGCILTAMIGSKIGAELVLLVSDYFFKILMLVVIPLTAFYVTRSKALITEKEPLTFGKTLAVSMPTALFLGAYDGFYGPGTGTFLMLLLTAGAHLSLKEANGVTKIINLTTNITSIIVFLTNGKILIALGLAAGIFNMAGNWLGAHCFDKHQSGIVRPLMIVVLTIFFIKLIYDLFIV